LIVSDPVSRYAGTGMMLDALLQWTRRGNTVLIAVTLN
jgi:hypothetical protein